MTAVMWRMGLQSQEERGQQEVELKRMHLELRQAAHPYTGPLRNHPRPPPAGVEEKRAG